MGGGGLGGCEHSFFSIEAPDMPLTLCHGDLMDAGKHALDHPSCQRGEILEFKPPLESTFNIWAL